LSVAETVVDRAVSGAHFLERLRGLHPVAAVGVALYLLSYSVRLRAGFARAWIVPLVCLQLLAGVLNVWLSAPGWMQVVHLALANLLWLAWCGAILDTALLSAGLEAVGADVDAVARAGTVSAS
jgi:cytochrome c oxidase assembly protein subunit 15/protoheme IX farnesyltransferase